jgi:hypothetical protein
LLEDPHYRPSTEGLNILTADVHEDIRGVRPRTLPNNVRKQIVGQIGEEAVATLLSQLKPNHTVIDLNRDVSRNHPGADFVIDQRLRIQVKASPCVELIGWSHTPDVNHVSFGYDLLAS